MERVGCAVDRRSDTAHVNYSATARGYGSTTPICGACKDACPIDIDLPKLLTRVRAGKLKGERTTEAVGLSMQSKIGLHLYGRIAASPRLFSIAQRLAGLGAIAISPFSGWIKLPDFTGWGYSKDFPRPAIKSFRMRHPREASSTFHEVRKEERFVDHKEKAKSIVGDKSEEGLVERFTKELDTLGVHVYRIHAGNLADTLILHLKKRKLEAALVWDEIPFLDEGRLKESGISLARSIDPTIKAGITGVVAAIAETGTLVISSGQGRPLSTSLLPEVHMAVISSSQIVRSLEEALKINAVRDASSTTLITGPSRTADIEMTLTIGVHGPGEVIVYIVEL